MNRNTTRKRSRHRTRQINLTIRKGLARLSARPTFRQEVIDRLSAALVKHITLPPAPCDRVPDGDDIPNVGPVDMDAFMKAFCDCSQAEQGISHSVWWKSPSPTP